MMGSSASIATGLANASCTGPAVNTSEPTGSSSAGIAGGCSASCAGAPAQPTNNITPTESPLLKYLRSFAFIAHTLPRLFFGGSLNPRVRPSFSDSPTTVSQQQNLQKGKQRAFGRPKALS